MPSHATSPPVTLCCPALDLPSDPSDLLPDRPHHVSPPICLICLIHELHSRQLTIRKSSDNAATWSEALLVEVSNSAGYSCLVDGKLDDGMKADDDDRRAAGGDCGGILFEATDGTIKFARFPLTFFA